MSKIEYKAMVDTGHVQVGAGGQTSVCQPPDSEAYRRQAAPGSVYVEFDVPTEALRSGGRDNWAIIPGPDSIFERLAGEVLEMPRASNVECVL
jgi:hypothetical protein